MSSLRKKIAFQLFYSKYKNKPRYTPCTIKYKEYVFDSPDNLSVIGQVKEIIFDEIYFFKPLSSTDVVIYDCGANVGVASIYLKKLYPTAKIYAFEPDPNIVNYFKKNINHNNITGIKVIEKAVWINNGTISFNSEGADGGSIGNNKNSISLECIRLKDLIEKETGIDLLKIDIEGAELEVLRDCKDVLNKVHHLFVEYHSDKTKSQKLPEILDILSTAGFRYSIESLHKKERPFIVKPEGNFDLQLNIFALNQKKLKNYIN